MAKIDTSRIEGYAGMTAEQKLSILEGFEYDDGSAEIERYKNAASKANSEAAEWKKKHNALLSEDEQSRAAAEEELTTLRNRVSELEEKELISSYKASLLSLGYEESLANATAIALANGEMDKVFTNLKKHHTAMEKTIREAAMKETPKPQGGNSSNAMTKEKLRQMSPEDRYAFSVEHPDEYKEIYGGNT